MKTLIGTLLLFSSLNVFAQSQSRDSFLHQLTADKAEHILALQGKAATANAKTTGIQQRLKTQTSYYMDTVGLLKAGDSAHFTYTGNNGSFYNYNRLSSYDYGDIDFTELIYSIKEYSPSIQTDSKVINYYDGMGRLDSLVGFYYEAVSNNFYKEYRISFAYNSTGQVTARTTEYIGNNIYELSKKEVWEYDSTGKLLVDSVILVPTTMVNYNYAAATVHSYDNAGKETEAYLFERLNNVWDSSAVMYSEYYTNGNYKKMTTVDVSNAPVPYISIDSFGYGGNAYYNYHGNFKDTIQTNGRNTIFEVSRHFDNAGKPDTVLSSSSLSTAIYKMAYTYNSFGNPDTIYTTMQNDSTFVPTYVFLYEEFDELSVVRQPAEQDASLVVYPNPATNTIRVRRDYDITAQEILTVWNASGQLMLRQQLENNTTTPISIDNCATGMYWLLVSDKTGKAIARKSFVKQ